MSLTPAARERRRTNPPKSVDDDCCFKCCRDSIVVCGDKCKESGEDCKKCVFRMKFYVKHVLSEPPPPPFCLTNL